MFIFDGFDIFISPTVLLCENYKQKCKVLSFSKYRCRYTPTAE